MFNNRKFIAETLIRKNLNRLTHMVPFFSLPHWITN